MPEKTSDTPAIGGTKPLFPVVKAVKRGFAPNQSRLPTVLKQLPGGGKGGKPPRFPGRAGGR